MDSPILKALPHPVLVVDHRREVVNANPAATNLFGTIHYNDDLSFTTRNPQILSAVDQALAGQTVDGLEINFNYPIAQSFELSLSEMIGWNGSPPDRKQVLMLFHDITPLRVAEKFRTDFVANVSHELRSPLVSLIGFIETLRTTAKGDEEAQEHFLSIMDTEAARMKSLIDDLLSLSKVEANEHVRPNDPVQIRNVIQMVLEPLRNKAELRGIELRGDFEEDLPEVAGSAEELIQVFNNLVDNAIKYGKASEPVTVSVTRIERIPTLGVPGIKISVHNQGDAIQPEHLPRLTERFYRIDKGRSRSVGGTGLGLAIVKHMVNRHRGRLTVESSAENGTIFSVFLPLAVPVDMGPALS